MDGRGAATVGHVACRDEAVNANKDMLEAGLRSRRRGPSHSHRSSPEGTASASGCRVEA